MALLLLHFMTSCPRRGHKPVLSELPVKHVDTLLEVLGNTMRDLEAAFRAALPPRYAYEPLKPTEIRLLRLLPGGALAGELVHTDLQNAPPYVALSYTWGPPRFSRRIQLHGRPLSVTRNLHSFLRHHGQRLAQSNELIWVDAVCIDQCNLEEKSLQIPLMKSIYESACRVEIWLGPSSGHSDLAMKTLRRWTAHLLPLVKSWGGQLDVASMEAIIYSPELLAPLQLKPDARYWTAIEQLCARPWWFRGWILQESTVTAPRYLYWGTLSIEFDVLAFALEVAKFVHDDTRVNAPFDIQLLTTQRREGSCTTLLEVLEKVRPWTCTDPRDKVYAGLGLVAGDTGQHIIPDYTRPAEDVYMDVVKTVLNRYPEGHRLDFLAHAVHLQWLHNKLKKLTGSVSVKRLSVPSWLPDWNRVVICYALPKSSSPNGLVAGTKVYNAAGTYPTQASLVGNQLRVLGLSVGVVSQISSSCYQYPFPPAEALAFLKTWVPKDSAQNYTARGTTQQAFLSTIVADVRRTRESVPCRGYAFDMYFSSLTADEINALPKEGAIAFSLALCNFMMTIWGRRLFWTTERYMGIGPGAMRRGDKICALFGGQVLYVLRDIRNGHHEFIGECYVHGLMDGEALHGFEAGQVKSETFIIV